MSQITRLPGEPPSPWESAYEYSRVVVAGPWVQIGGTTAVDPTGVIIGHNLYEQAAEIFRKLLAELARTGLTAADVVATRAYVTDISRAGEVGRAHAEAFAPVRPLFTLVEVSALIDPRMLVEIELSAYRALSSDSAPA
jgi:enamine deaminase RidA (YjgF/YER057c/UK114 family)